MTIHSRAIRQVLALSLLGTLAACGGDGGGGNGGGNGPTPTPVSLAITTATAAIKLGQTETYAATMTYSNNSTQTVTATWESDNASVLTIDANGRASGIAAGLASITARSAGLSSPGKLIQVVPDYQGTWQGDFKVTRCDTSGAFNDTDLCGTADGIRVGDLLPIQVTASQSGTTVTGTLDFGEGIAGPMSGSIEAGGTFNGTASLTITIDNVTMTTAVNPIRLRAEGDRLTGTFTAESTIPGAPGGWILAGELRSVPRTSTTDMPRGRDGASFGSWREMRGALRAQ